MFEEFDVIWWEEPFSAGALTEYSHLSNATRLPLAAGEGSNSADQAKHLIDYGKVRLIQIDAGRIGGITAAREVAEYAAPKNASFVNHTFTSNLALSASLQAYADQRGYAEVPVATSALARAIGGPTWALDSEGGVTAPDAPGLGIEPDLALLKPYLQEVEIRWNGRELWPR